MDNTLPHLEDSRERLLASNGRALAMQGERLLFVTGRRILNPVHPALPGLTKRYGPVRT
jgi:hypothetical protein